MIITLRWNEAAGSPGILWRIGMTGAGGMPTHLRRPHPSQGKVSKVINMIMVLRWEKSVSGIQPSMGVGGGWQAIPGQGCPGYGGCRVLGFAGWRGLVQCGGRRG